MTDVIIKTGEKARVSGFYGYNGPTNASEIGCNPTPNERVIPLKSGETAPPVKSCPAGANWKFLRGM
ncbi:MAG: YjzC family protein [Rhabdochlamydiaceae bacterium]